MEGGQGRKYGVVYTGLASSLSLWMGSQGPYLHPRTFVLTKTPFPFRGLSLPISTMGLQSLSQECSLRKPFRVCFGENPETALRKSPGDLNSLLRHSQLALSFLVPPPAPEPPSGHPHPQVDDDYWRLFLPLRGSMPPRGAMSELKKKKKKKKKLPREKGRPWKRSRPGG